MCVASPIIYDGTVVGAVRLVTSLRLVDRQIALVVLLAFGVGILIIAIVYFSNLYFVRSIVEPVAGITDIAQRIAGGSYGIQMEKKSDDEIGDLIDAINDMSMKINQAEKLKSEFISSVSHELRTPLTAINGWAETMAGGELREAEDMKKAFPSSSARRGGSPTWWRSCWTLPASRTAASLCPSSRWTSRRSWRTRCIPTGNSSAGRASP